MHVDLSLVCRQPRCALGNCDGTRLALGEQQLYAAARMTVHDCVVLSLLVITQVVERCCWRNGRLWWGKLRGRGRHCTGGSGAGVLANGRRRPRQPWCEWSRLQGLQAVQEGQVGLSLVLVVKVNTSTHDRIVAIGCNDIYLDLLCV